MEQDSLTEVFLLLRASPARKYFETEFTEYFAILEFFMHGTEMEKSVNEINCTLFRSYVDNVMIPKYMQAQLDPDFPLARDDQLFHYYSNQRKEYPLPWFKNYSDPLYRPIVEAHLTFMLGETKNVLLRNRAQLAFRPSGNYGWYDATQLFQYADMFYDKIKIFIELTYDSKIADLSTALQACPLDKSVLATDAAKDVTVEQFQVSGTGVGRARQNVGVLLEAEKMRLLAEADAAKKGLTIDGFTGGSIVLSVLTALVVLSLVSLGVYAGYRIYKKKRGL